MIEPDERRQTTIFRSDLFTVADDRRRGPKRAWGRETGGFSPRIVFTRNGVYACASGDEIVVTHRLNAKFYDGEHTFRFRRLAHGGEDLTVIIPERSIVEEALEGIGCQTGISPALYLAQMRLYARLARGPHDTLGAEEALLDLLHQLAVSWGAGEAAPRPNASVRKRLDEARAFIAAEPEADHRLADVAQVAGASPYHFARLFRVHTGHSLRAYRRRLRVAQAVNRLSGGDEPLACVALDAGFSHQSHMTAAFRKVLDSTPDCVRRSLRGLN